MIPLPTAEQYPTERELLLQLLLALQEILRELDERITALENP